VPKTLPKIPTKGTTRGPLPNVTLSPYAKLVATEIGKVWGHQEPQDDSDWLWDDALFFRPTDKDPEGKGDEDDEGVEAEPDGAIALEELDNANKDYEE